MDGTTAAESDDRASRRWIAHARHGLDDVGPHAAALPAVSWREGRGAAPSRGGTVRMSRLITIDGSEGEGGGQILRTALSLSLLTGKPFRIVKIRANRDKPGLRPQHLAAVQAAATLGGAVEGAAVGARDLTFRPSAYQARDLHIDIGTAGSTGMVLHTLHLPLALRADGPVRLTLDGGTFNTRAPSFPFLETTWRAHMARLGLTVGLAMPTAGFYPRGGGRLDVWIEPGKPRPIALVERPPLTSLRGVAGVANLGHRDVAERMELQAAALLAEAGFEAPIDRIDWRAPSPGAAFALTADYGGIPATFVGLGERGKPAEQVAREAVAEFLAHDDSGGAIDAHSADQLLLPLALAEGRSLFTVAEVTGHLRTNAETIAAFLDRPIRIDEGEDGPARVVVG